VKRVKKKMKNDGIWRENEVGRGLGGRQVRVGEREDVTGRDKVK